ncbi:ABC transporter substrate-binding protein [Nonomuraea turkmeniaca]|uniref:ABC transporter substrate-binding protein n=1 Tax=Nonomuraea turkmeniaca TaxID=103838 RepID=A0A5S4FHA4_9ACTN|nr:ABC transporter substrate-binding protein [Nonomuraea turkmeniaca]TMR19298.1 ABC transporter substrate-binding protein [Nonomuraea turkmeniaca]
MTIRVGRVSTAGIALALALTAGCSGASGAPKALAKAVLKVATTANVTTWDPVKSFSTEVFYLANVYEPLLWKNPPGSAQPYTPALAESWEASADKKTWTFHLRPGVTFHDGEPMNAAAVKASIEAAKDHGGAAFIWAPLKEITTPDDKTVVMSLSYAAPMELIASSMYGAWIVSPKALAAVKADEKYYESGKDGGTGAYTVAEYTSGQRVVLKKHAAYWGGWDKGQYATVVNTITPEAVVQQQMLTGGQVDIATSLPLENIGRMRSDPKLSVIDCATASSYLGFFNTAKKPLDDPKVRRALSYAIPYKEIIEVGAQGFGTQARGPVPAGVFPYSESTPQYVQDLGKARELLADAGYADGGGLKLKLTYAAENQSQKRFAPLIKDAFAKVGVTVDVQAILFNQQWEQAKAGPAKAQDIFLLLYWPTYSDAGSDNLWSLFHSSEKPFFNLSYWNDAKFDKLVEKAGTLTATDQARARAMYGQAMSRLHEQAPGFFLYDVKAPLVAPKGITGLTCNPDYSFNIFFHRLAPA